MGVNEDQNMRLDALEKGFADLKTAMEQAVGAASTGVSPEVAEKLEALSKRVDQLAGEAADSYHGHTDLEARVASIESAGLPQAAGGSDKPSTGDGSADGAIQPNNGQVKADEFRALADRVADAENKVKAMAEDGAMQKSIAEIGQRIATLESTKANKTGREDGGEANNDASDLQSLRRELRDVKDSVSRLEKQANASKLPGSLAQLPSIDQL